MYRESDFFMCDYCGMRKPTSQMAGKCVACGKFLCSTCAKPRGGKIYCSDHLPPPPRGGCFIATATYGTPMAQEIDVLRSFRDLKLNSNKIGVKIVELYYRISPPIANAIANNEILKTTMRYILSPIVNFLKNRGY